MSVAIERWLSPSIEGSVLALTRWFTARPRSIATIADVLPARTAAAIRDALVGHPHWVTSRHLHGSATGTLEVGSDEWNATPAPARFSAHDIIRPLNALVQGDMPLVQQHALIGFAHAALLGSELRLLLQSITGMTLDPRASCELTRYQRTHFIAPHSDHFDQRPLGVVFHFDDCTADDGGVLHFQNEEGVVSQHIPRFNSATLIPVDPACNHWVTPWDRATAGRHAISLAYRPA